MASRCAHVMAAKLLSTLLAASGASCFSGGAGFEPGTAQLEIVAHDLQGRLLRIDVQYSGGCTEHEIRICWTGIAAPSVPPQVPLEIHHYDLGDSCEALVSKSLYIDMAELNRAAGDSGADVSFYLPLESGGTRGLLGIHYVFSDESLEDGPEPTHVIDRSCGIILG